jgi:Protein of unknown function (DUF1161)
MRPLAAMAVLVFASVSACAQAPKPCEELKAEITKKLEAKDVKGFSLEIVDKSKDAEGKVVGTCDGGMKKIVYSKAAATPQVPAKPAPGKP